MYESECKKVGIGFQCQIIFHLSGPGFKKIIISIYWLSQLDFYPPFLSGILNSGCQSAVLHKLYVPRKSVHALQLMKNVTYKKHHFVHWPSILGQYIWLPTSLGCFFINSVEIFQHGAVAKNIHWKVLKGQFRKRLFLAACQIKLLIRKFSSDVKFVQSLIQCGLVFEPNISHYISECHIFKKI